MNATHIALFHSIKCQKESIHETNTPVKSGLYFIFTDCKFYSILTFVGVLISFKSTKLTSDIPHAISQIVQQCLAEKHCGSL